MKFILILNLNILFSYSIFHYKMHCQLFLYIFATIAALGIHSVQAHNNTTEELAKPNEDGIDKQIFALIGQIGSKEYFGATEGEKVNWMDARQKCKEAGLDFAKLESADEFNFIYENQRGQDFWISAAMKGVAGFGENILQAYEYSDGSPVPADINLEHGSLFWLCLYVSGDHHTFPDHCVTSTHNVLCQKKA